MINSLAIYLDCLLDADIHDARQIPGSNFYPALTANGGDTDEDYYSVVYYPDQEPLADDSCGWLFKIGMDEDGGDIIRQCSGRLTITDRGHHCTVGHEYVTMETRYAEGWDYCSDDEAAGMMRQGIEPRDMLGHVIHV